VGYIPLALGDQGWQQLIVFDAVVLASPALNFAAKHW
jgi:hypothetical protein